MINLDYEGRTSQSCTSTKTVRDNCTGDSGKERAVMDFPEFYSDKNIAQPRVIVQLYLVIWPCR